MNATKIAVADPEELAISDEDFKRKLNKENNCIDVLGVTMCPGTVLYELDYTAFSVMQSNEPSQWICPLCKGLWEDEDDAKWCCQEETWECECGEVYLSEIEAQDCCVPKTEEQIIVARLMEAASHDEATHKV